MNTPDRQAANINHPAMPVRTQEEVATIMGMTRDAVSMLESRAMRKLRKAILNDPWFLENFPRLR